MMVNDVQEILLSEEKIDLKIRELGKLISEEYAGKDLLVIGVLKGSVIFVSDLVRNISIPCEIDFMSVSSYDGTESIGDVRILKDMDLSCKNRSILVVEDIIDTGRTLVEVKKMFKNKGCLDVSCVNLLDNPSRRVCEIDADYVGFEVQNEFVVRYGLDYNQKYRNLPFVGVLKPEIYQ